MYLKRKYLILPCVLATLVHHTAFSQIPVRMEPRHKMVLENAYLRLLNVHIAPGDTSLYHIHATPSVVIILTQSLIGSQQIGKLPSAPGEVTPGITDYKDYGNHPLIHRVWNQGPDTFHVMDIELLRKQPDTIPWPDFPTGSMSLNWEKPLVRCFHLTLNAGSACQLPPSNCPHLLVMIHGTARTGNTDIDPGDYKWIPAQKEVTITTRGPADGVVLELK